MTRDNYELQSSFVSTKNEPWFGLGHYKKYPDMYEAYKSFSEKYDISTNNFILTNGGENAVRWALLGLNAKNIKIEHPSWRLIETMCEAFNIKYSFFNYHFYKGMFYPDSTDDDDLVYTTDTYNNLFEHLNIVHAGPAIIDETYTMATLNDKYRILRDDQIIVGSFSKVCGPGYRLGYCLFSDKHSEKMHMLREQYIGSDAADLIINPYKIIPIGADDINTKLNLVSVHPVYLTFQIDDLPVPHKKFKVDGVNFCRINTTNDIKKQVKKLERLLLKD